MLGNILTPDGWIRGRIVIEDGTAAIAAIEGGAADPASNSDDYILPGFIDLHVHGGAGRDMMEGGDAPHVIARLHARHGTTSLLATTMTAPLDDIDRALAAIGTACEQRGKGEARILGVHLEGPYINSGKLGAQPPFAREATMAEVARFDAQAPMRLITVAPEIDGHLALVRALSDAGIRVSPRIFSTGHLMEWQRVYYKMGIAISSNAQLDMELERGRILWQDGAPGAVTIFRDEPEAALGRKLLARLIALLPIESQL